MPVRLALAATRLLPPLAVLTLPMASVLVLAPVEVTLTDTVTVQLPEAGMVAPARLTVLAAATAVTVPPLQVVAPAGVAALTRLAG